MTTITMDPTTTRFATSADGTEIAYEVSGDGPALVLVDGAMCFRELGVSRDMAKTLADTFRVYVYDRRDRGESGSGRTPWSLDREIEDLAAVIEAAGGRAHVFGASSGGALVLEAAQRDIGIDRAYVYEVPFIVDHTHAPADPDEAGRLGALVAEDRRGDAVKGFMRIVGVPVPFIGLMRIMPAWKKMAGIAHTLPYDLTIIGGHRSGAPLPEGRYSGVRVPTRIGAGGKSPDFMRNAAAAIATSVPGAALDTIEGQTHMLKPKAVKPALTAFLLG